MSERNETRAYLRDEPEIERLRRENKRLNDWVNDLLCGRYVNCVYCGHRYGPTENTPVSMADLLKQHIEQCEHHPMSALKRQLADTEHRLTLTTAERDFARERIAVYAADYAETLAGVGWMRDALEHVLQAFAYAPDCGPDWYEYVRLALTSDCGRRALAETHKLKAERDAIAGRACELLAAAERAQAAEREAIARAEDRERARAEADRIACKGFETITRLDEELTAIRQFASCLKHPDDPATATSLEIITAAYRRRADAEQQFRHRLRELSTALRDVLSTFRHDDKTTVITGDRQEMWQHILEQHGSPP